ncbi:MAG: hypothetical protein EGS39_01995 [Bifidobacterium bifidum]|nr:hypothetical protein [Bifidobacterium bifidum]
MPFHNVTDTSRTSNPSIPRNREPSLEHAGKPRQCPPDRTGGKPRRGRPRTPEPLRQADIPDLINIGGGFGRRVGLRL